MLGKIKKREEKRRCNCSKFWITYSQLNCAADNSVKIAARTQATPSAAYCEW